MSAELHENLFTFGKYKGKTLDFVLKDRNYCEWLLKPEQEWFKTNYEYLYNKVRDYNPLSYFLDVKKESNDTNFIASYKYFNMKPIESLKITLSDEEKKCYMFYLEMIDTLKSKIIKRVEDDEDNFFDIKAPTGWLKIFEKKYELNREVFKTFINSYDLPNITTIIEEIKKNGGIEYKGAKSFIIAKDNSLKQEKHWELILKEVYGQDIGTQFKYEKCIFDFLNISTNTVFECKLSLKDFNDEQHKKYKATLGKYRIIYLIDIDCVIWIENKVIYTTDHDKYDDYIFNMQFSSRPLTYLDELIKDFKIVKIDNISSVFGKS